ncbi:hypothetical protein Nepgr_020792 [Nepenthes gracilis]|uniref:MAPK kinase substrate protein n=1 Tax=Nepenthes gracilis TaxID=150966 RepID=A0AAD3SZI8_NEPGR|nr:hypothetical protein Nepgr_020792 [Nepenthes gracilis]
MTGLRRSAISFRRQGSSGLVWEDKFLSGELNDRDHRQEKSEKEDQGSSELRRSKSDRGRHQDYRPVKVEQAEDPPSPKVSGCGFRCFFGKTPTKTEERRTGKRKA